MARRAICIGLLPVHKYSCVVHFLLGPVLQCSCCQQPYALQAVSPRIRSTDSWLLTGERQMSLAGRWREPDGVAMYVMKRLVSLVCSAFSSGISAEFDVFLVMISAASDITVSTASVLLLQRVTAAYHRRIFHCTCSYPQQDGALNGMVGMKHWVSGGLAIVRCDTSHMLLATRSGHPSAIRCYSASPVILVTPMYFCQYPSL